MLITLKAMSIKLITLFFCLNLFSCSTTKVWHLNDSIPSRVEHVERQRFDKRMRTFLGFYIPKDRVDNYYVVNDNKLIIDTPFFLTKEWENKLPSVICNPRANMSDCQIIIH